MNKIKLCVCDWDGTLVDSVKKITACKQQLAQKYHLMSPTEAQVKSALGLPFAVALQKSFPNATSATLNKIGEEFHHLMQTEAYQALPFAGAIETLADLKQQKNIILAIATAKAQIELNQALIYLKLTALFDVVCCSEHYAHKPDPTMLQFIIKKTGVHADETIMIGDTTADMQFAHNANVIPIAVSFGAHSLDQLQLHHPRYVLNTWYELPELLNEEKPCIT